ncbi:ferredoxin [Embleya sp. NPDC059259]|uniref:ferredoxin n=1 Tax=unclassified Embleya TaxID=2699296 RepID=UPI00369B3555
MRVTVDTNLCQSHGQCVFAAPAVFSFDEDDYLHYDTNPSDEYAAHVRAAASMCPVRAITVDADAPRGEA